MEKTPGSWTDDFLRLVGQEVRTPEVVVVEVEDARIVLVVSGRQLARRSP
jgi:hypothetical protein